MTTVRDIQNGNYCEKCDANCRLFLHEADCCLYDTTISRLAVKIGTENPDKEVNYEYAGKPSYLLTIENSDNLDKPTITKTRM